MNHRKRSMLARARGAIFSRHAITLLVFVAVFAAATTAIACPTCKDGIAGADASSQAMARGYFYSILFMMAMPFVIIGTFGGAAYVSIRRAREQQAKTDQNRTNEPGNRKENV